MLTRLSIRDFAVVAQAELEFGAGLTVISGETGAGKSLLVDALGFLCGARADAGSVRHGAQRAELAAEFSLVHAPAATRWLGEAELDDADDTDTCKLRRTLRADGGSRAWINGRPVTLVQLAELTSLLLEIHGQHAQQALLARTAQTDLLDAHARHPALQQATRDAALRWRALRDEREALLARGDVTERQSWLQHQLQELLAETLEPDALIELDRGHRRHAHAASLISACELGLQQLTGEDALGTRLQQLRVTLQREAVHEPRLDDLDVLLDSAAIQIDEGLSMLERIRDDLDLDPDAMLELERRLTRIQDLARKHRLRPDQLAAHRDVLASELDSLADAEQQLQRLQQSLQAASAQWLDAATALTASRRRAGDALAMEVSALIGTLGMDGGRFEVALEPAPNHATPDPNGAERVDFLVSANAGQPPRPLRKVASGGELSRISLAIEVAMQGLDPLQTMVFDEVDAGIGGAVAAAVGARLRALGGGRQVLCVTHQPQVAAAGHAHYRVSKASQEGITQSSVEHLDDSGRVVEIARMLGGVEVTAEAQAAARQLLGV